MRKSPSVPEMIMAPELALIIALDGLLALLRPALVAQHPTVPTELPQSRDPPTLRLARAVLRDGLRLRRRLRNYRDAVEHALTHAKQIDDQLPF
jgi:hypothetical protein